MPLIGSSFLSVVPIQLIAIAWLLVQTLLCPLVQFPLKSRYQGYYATCELRSSSSTGRNALN